MKNKKIVLPILLVLGIIILLAVSFFIFAAVMTSKGYGMSDLSEKGGLFEGITTGDKIIVIHTGIAESYPAQTGAYWLMKIGEGDRDDIPDKIIEDLSAMGWLSHVYSDKYSFSLRFGTYGESFYDWESGRLVKTTNAKNPSKYVTEYHMTEEEFDAVLNIIWSMDISAYPDEYDPINPPDAEEKLVSNPYETLVLTYRAGDYEKVITCEEVALGGGGYDERAEAFLELCRYIKRIVVNSEEWASLPAPEMIHE